MMRLVVLAALLLAAVPVSAQDYPNKPIRLVVQFSAGGGADFLARIFSNEMPGLLGQQIIVDNRPGANGTIANQLVATAPADGYTLLLSAAGPMVVNPHLYGKSAVDPIKDFVPISLAVTSRFIVVVNPSVPVHSIQELTALAKAKPGTLNFSSSGNGGSPHLAGELYKYMAGVNIVHVPYKGMSQAISDLVSGQVQITFSDIGLVAGPLQAGLLRAIASTGAVRSAIMPDLPTLNESGLPGYEAGTWYGLHGPAGMPPAIVQKLSAAVREVVARPAVRERILGAGVEPIQTTPEQFAAFQQADYDKWAKIIKEAGIKPE